jgi:3-deoxy-D-manno-octulosonic-acid transferase
MYKIAYTLGFLLTWPFWLLRDVVHHKPYSFKARFLGPGRMLPKTPGRPRVWVWTLSLGEVLAARRLVPALEEAGAEVVISSTTAIGRDMAARAWPSRLILASPLDFGLSTRRFLEAVDPDLLVLVETDIWPGILFRMRQRGSPSALVSARISPRSFRGYGYIKVFWGRVLRLFDLITAQSESDRGRLVTLGADPGTTEVIGDLKFDREVKPSTPESRAAVLAETGWPEGRWIVAGSTHAGEENIILDTFTQLKEKSAEYADLKLLLAPRNKSDFQAVWSLIQARNLPAGHRGDPQASDGQKDIFLLDTLGELERFYDLAEIALVGKSWAGQHKGGGHNPLEPASKGKPVLFGPMTHNYRWMTKALTEAGGGRMIPDQPALLAALEELLDHPDQAREMGRRAADFVRSHQGGTRRTVDLLRPFIEKVKAHQ